jgi:soluble lytic murein transglycosylase
MAMLRLWANIPILHRCCGASLTCADQRVATRVRPRSHISDNSPGFVPNRLLLTGIVLASLSFLPGAGTARAQAQATPQAPSQTARKPAAKSATAPPAAVQPERQLQQLARALHDQSTASLYEQLSQFAAAHDKTVLGARAALALGYYDLEHKDFLSARTWLEKASADPLLAEYALYFRAQADRGMGANLAALDEFYDFRMKYPDSVMSDLAVEALAQTALAAGRPEAAVVALDGYPQATAKASLILLRAQAREKVAAAKGEKPFAATTDYLDLVYRFPLSDEAKSAAYKIPILQSVLGDQFPGVPLQTEITRAETFYSAQRWSDVRLAYAALLPKLSGVAHERAVLRMAQADAQTAAGTSTLASLELTDAALDAERLYTFCQLTRSTKVESDIVAATEKLATQYPQNPWTEQALFETGNFYWTNLDRAHAAEYYQRVLTSFPETSDGGTAHWRIAWTAYMDRQDNAVSLLEQYIQEFPNSTYVVDALYWLGRANERGDNVAHARSFYVSAVQRFPQTYFGQRAGERLREIGRDPVDPAEFLSAIPPAVQLDQFDETLPAAAEQPWVRAEALRSIAFDSSAEMELRAAYAATHAPQLLQAVAEAAVAAGHYGAGIMTVRQMVPQLEARQFEDVPGQIWRAGFPLPYRDSLEREARRNHIDPMLVAGLIRQESAFASNAVSWTSCCFGLMQVKTSTGADLARRLKVRFSRARLFEPDYNLRLGTYYISGLLASYPAPEYALAAYNAGETRVAQWTTGQKYEETPEFVESIPFTQTRDYVQVVLRNAELYRQVYGIAVSADSTPPPAPAKP